jgi:hypothetical protein
VGLCAGTRALRNRTYSLDRLPRLAYVLVRLSCDACNRAGSYRLARLAVKYGAEILLDDLLVRLSADLSLARRPSARPLRGALHRHAPQGGLLFCRQR